MKRIAVMSLLVAMLGGCGSDSTSPTPQGGAHYTTKEVIAAFARATHDTLRIDRYMRSIDGDRDLLSFKGPGELAGEIPPRYLNKYGDFVITVLDGVAAQAACKDRWWQSPESGGWVTGKCYGSNVFMTWVAGQQQKKDARWRRVDAALSTLTNGS